VAQRVTALRWEAVFNTGFSRLGNFMPFGTHCGTAKAALDAYRSIKYDYVRQVEAHSHWIGLAMLMIAWARCSDD